MTLPSPGPGRPQHPDLTASKGRTRAEPARLYCTCETRTDPGCPIHGLRTRRGSRRGSWLAVGLGIVAIVLGITVERASAAPFTPELEAEYAYAEAWWGAQPIGCSSVTKEVVPRALIQASGLATIPQAGMPPVPCTIWIAEEVASVPCLRREVVLHEYGHLLGYGHSADPASIMAPEVPGTGCKAEAEAIFSERLRREGRRCRHLRPSRHRQECWRGVRQERRAFDRLFG